MCCIIYAHKNIIAIFWHLDFCRRHDRPVSPATSCQMSGVKCLLMRSSCADDDDESGASRYPSKAKEMPDVLSNWTHMLHHTHHPTAPAHTLAVYI